MLHDLRALIEAARGQQQALLDKVTGELAAEVAAERARREEAARVKYSAPPASYPDVGPPNGSASRGASAGIAARARTAHFAPASVRGCSALLPVGTCVTVQRGASGFAVTANEPRR